MLNLVKRRYLFLGISLLVIVPGLVSLLLFGLNVGIDFKGGSIWNVTFTQPKTNVGTEDVISVVKSAVNNDPAFQSSTVQLSSNPAGVSGQTIILRTPFVTSGPTKDAIIAALIAKYGPMAGGANKDQPNSFDSIGPSIGSEVTLRSAAAVVLCAIGILIYITYAFRRVKRPFVYGACAIIAMLHDVLVVVGIFSILGVIFRTQVDALFVTALLTVIGFSVHDTIVVFDRIRENAIKAPGEDIESVVNHSLVQTLARSLTTSLTVVFTLLALYLFGGVTIRDFVLALLVGIVSGTYSSIFNASMLLVIWEKGEWRNWFGGNRRAAVRPA